MPDSIDRPEGGAAGVNASVAALGSVVRAPGKSRRPWRFFLLLLGPLLVLAAGGYLYITGGRFVETDNAYLKADTVSISAEVAGAITEVSVLDNQPVSAGQELLRLDDRPFRIAVARAEAQLRAVGEDLERLKAAYRQQAEELKMARTDVDYAQREFDRQSPLAGKNIVSESRLDESRHILETARQRASVIQQEMAQTRAQLGGDPDAPLESQARYLEARAALDQAALDLKHTVVRAPFAGIASRTPDVGQHVTAGAAVMIVVAGDGLWVEANFKETDLTHLRPGQPATITVDTYPDRAWHGTVESISQATGAEFSVLPPQNATGNWVKVVQRIPVRIAVDAEARDPVLRSGMSASVEVDSGHRRAIPSFLSSLQNWLGGPAMAATPAADAPP